MKSKSIRVETLSRVEGEGALNIKIKDHTVTDVKLEIYEPPRFFEAFLRGRSYREAPDVTARICGICHIAYQTAAAQAMERAFGVTVHPQVRALRRLIYLGEWIESHALHVFMLHAPDFLGYQDAIALAKDKPEVVKMALDLKKVGNDLVILIGGREIHSINLRVGGFYRMPTKKEMLPLVDRLKWARDAAIQSVRLVSTFNFPDFERDYEFLSLRHPKEYPITEGRLVTNRGLDIDISEYENHFQEEHVEHSNALQSVHKDKGTFFVGPLARYNLNYDQLPKIAKQAAEDVKLGKYIKNPFKGIIVRAVENVFAAEEALRIIEEYEPAPKPFVEVEPRAATGWGATEAPRGLLYHRYSMDAKGVITGAKIVPPTSQNLRTIEEDLWQFVPPRISLPTEQLTWVCEQAVRNYDPCISCATHFLKLNIDNER